MKSKTTILLLLCCFAISFASAQGKLNKAKDDLSGSSSNSSSSSSSSWNDDDNGRNDYTGFFDGGIN